ncbi:class I SAM-dependent methyltransferase [Alteromonas pelagimontana]|uniref:Class I SAM-dependent methyltransferase n=1 Tax=Alteromonas pelagimontana TaxID=1858656 RepID=A0A6M4MEK3_9ALTE|nr:class I SAM-dependent methyltransferase [Alteromonas pelagimontana]QJR81529.1 class I SAM-dependent methyltransferase [Alteromonas pelagimontana]
MNISTQLEELIKRLERIENSVKTPGGSAVYHTNKVRNDLTSLIKRHDYICYRQIEAFTKLSSLLSNFQKLPPLRGWAISPDVALRLYNFVLQSKPKNVLEFGSGASSFIIAEAMKKNGFGKLTSVDHLKKYSDECKSNIESVGLGQYVDFIVSPLEEWNGEHLDVENTNFWYSLRKDLVPDDIDFLFIDGPPGIKCKFSRYPAMVFSNDKLSLNFQVWLDDSDRSDEQAIIESWTDKYSLNCEQLKLEKGLAIFRRRESPEFR